MKSLSEACAIIAGQVKTLPAAPCSLAEADGHILASPVLADRDIPPSNRSAMDGYAFLTDKDCTTPFCLEVRGEIPAGIPPPFALRKGECARIFTGASIPEGADTVVIQEDTTIEGETRMRIHKAPERGANILLKGENALSGSVLVKSGSTLSAIHIGMCAAVGRARLDVIPKPRIAILTTGEELLDVSATAASHQIRDSNGPMIAAQLQIARFSVNSCRRVRDSEEAIIDAARSALASTDVLLITGGVSVGKYDFVPATLTQLGAALHFHGVAVKPGKPQLFATLGKDKYIFGLPGNPLSVMVGLQELVIPTLKKLSGFTDEECRPSLRVPVSGMIKSLKGQHHFVPAHLTWTKTGPEARVIIGHGSADLVSACEANGFVIVPPDTQVLPGALLDFRPWGTVP